MPDDLRNAKFHLFYQTAHPRPTLDRAEGIYMWNTRCTRFIDGSSGAMVCNIGHSNPHVLDAMRRRMDKSTFGYRLHFVTETSEALATKTAALDARRLMICPRRSRGGYASDHVLIAPPMITTAAQVGVIMELLTDAI